MNGLLSRLRYIQINYYLKLLKQRENVAINKIIQE